MSSVYSQHDIYHGVVSYLRHESLLTLLAVVMFAAKHSAPTSTS